MAWKKVVIANIPTWDYKKNREFIGIFKSMQENVGPNNSKIYTFETEELEEIGVWGSSVLDARLKNLVPGEKIKIEYLGLLKSQKSGRNYHGFEVYKDE